MTSTPSAISAAAAAAAPATIKRGPGRPRKDRSLPPPPPPVYLPPNQETAGAVDTAQAAFYVRRTRFTLHKWAQRPDAPLKPIRTGRGAPLMWAMADIRKFLRIEA